MKVYVHPADLYGCGHYRLIFVSKILQRQGFDVTIVPPGDPGGMSAMVDNTGKVHDVYAPKDADVMVFQRPSFPQLAGSIPILRSKGIAVVVDVDDDLAHIPQANPAWVALHPKNRASPHDWKAVSNACRDATLVTVSTPALTNRYGRGHAHVIENHIPAAVLEIQHRDSDVIGWAGSWHSHPGDLGAMGGAVGQLVRRGREFFVVGAGAGAERELEVDKVVETGSIDFKDWPAAVSKIGIGVAPLRDSKFNEAKSWLKPLEYSATGVPWVASPRAEYVRFHERGAGILAERPRDWMKALTALASEQARVELSEAGRDVARGLTVEANSWRWMDAWERALAIERSQPRPVGVGSRQG